MAWGLGLGGCDRRRAQMEARIAGAPESNPACAALMMPTRGPACKSFGRTIVGREPRNHGAKDVAGPARLG